MGENPRILRGGCECGAIGYEVDDDFRYAANCHCSRCRANTGSAFKPFGGIERTRFRVTKGRESVWVLGEPDLHDSRCRECGSLLYSVVRDGGWVHVAYGSLIDTPTLAPQGHIFVGSKADWYQITDHLPQAQEYD